MSLCAETRQFPGLHSRRVTPLRRRLAPPAAPPAEEDVPGGGSARGRSASSGGSSVVSPPGTAFSYPSTKQGAASSNDGSDARCSLSAVVPQCDGFGLYGPTDNAAAAVVAQLARSDGQSSLPPFALQISRLEQKAHALRLRRMAKESRAEASARACSELLQMKAAQVAAIERAETGLLEVKRKLAASADPLPPQDLHELVLSAVRAPSFDTACPSPTNLPPPEIRKLILDTVLSPHNPPPPASAAACPRPPPSFSSAVQNLSKSMHRTPRGGFPSPSPVFPPDAAGLHANPGGGLKKGARQPFSALQNNASSRPPCVPFAPSYCERSATPVFAHPSPPPRW
ncbi:hypothetical protein DIPPA_10933 [Diplonema papillatum]|nr:hypothetical protein DIPPA_10933 [Diplonema papillatum]